MTEELPGPHGPLASVLAVRSRTGILEHREALVYTLGKAAELEHLVMLQYLFAAFSLKQDVREGVTQDQLVAIQRWRKTLLEISAQEMLHLALVQNLLTAVGAAPRFARPNFPMPAYAYPAGVRIELLPFGEAALRHFAFLERPEGMDVEDAEGFEAFERAVAFEHDDDDAIVPHLGEFETIGALYRAIGVGLERIAGRIGPERLFIGPANAQATEEHFRWEELVAVTDLASAGRAIDTIVEQGEGAQGEWRDAHFGRLLGILDDYLALKAADPDFEPARPVVAANVRQQATGVVVPLITDPGTARAMDLLNVVYEVLLQLLSRYFAHSDESPEQLRVLADVAVGLMFAAIKPLGAVVTTLPIGWETPGVTAGPGFELFYQVDYLLPHREAAWVLMEERLRDAAAFAVRCGEACSPALMEPLAKVARALERYADQLLAASKA
ncbi:MAG TPA: ferritin-like domain-containing protein [Candidatus Limnocylindrales bacterium]|nr:ferritin-like domain-containing protein [Candidatus Limnocylindrales bacterium]